MWGKFNRLHSSSTRTLELKRRHTRLIIRTRAVSRKYNEHEHDHEEDVSPRPVFRATGWSRTDDRVPTLAHVSECLEISRGLERDAADEYMRSEGIDPDRAKAYVDVVDRLERAWGVNVAAAPSFSDLFASLIGHVSVFFAHLVFAVAMIACDEDDLL